MSSSLFSAAVCQLKKEIWGLLIAFQEEVVQQITIVY